VEAIGGTCRPASLAVEIEGALGLIVAAGQL
jgi:hypothetical protein